MKTNDGRFDAYNPTLATNGERYDSCDLTLVGIVNKTGIRIFVQRLSPHVIKLFFGVTSRRLRKRILTTDIKTRNLALRGQLRKRNLY